MQIEKFIKKFKNHPVLFVGAGLSFRYLDDSYRWDDLLKKIAFESMGSNEYYYDLKSRYLDENGYRYDKIASSLEKDFNELLIANRDGKFKYINDLFYQNMENNINISRFKLFIADMLKELKYKDTPEISEFKKTRKNISSVITTNYDTMIEDIFAFNPLIGNNILLSNPYGSLYKIHGCVTEPKNIIITEEDYKYFESKYELIRAQLLSLFIHNPIIFLGYSLSDQNIKKILKTIFTYVDNDSEEAEKIRSNFLLVEYEEGSSNKEVVEHDIDVEGVSTIRINKIKTDDYTSIYKALSSLELPVSAMDIRKVQSVVREIYSGGKIKVSITEDLDELNNGDKVLAIGSKNNIQYVHQNAGEMIKKYFEIIEEENVQILDLVDKINIQAQQYFPIYGFSLIKTNIEKTEVLKKQQYDKIESIINESEEYLNKKFISLNNLSLEFILKNDSIPKSRKNKIIVYAVIKDKVHLGELKKHIDSLSEKIDQGKENKNTSLRTEYKMLICTYDYKMYSN